MSSPYTGVATNVTNANVNSVTNVTNTSPMVVQTATPHNYASGDSVVIFFVNTPYGANSAQNKPWTITVVDSTHFSLNGSTAGGAYTGPPGVCVDISLTPFFQIPSDGDPFNAAAFNNAIQSLADRTQFIQSKLADGFTLVAQYVGEVGDNSWSQWASATGGGTSFFPVSSTTYFPYFGDPRCNNGDVFEIHTNLGNVTISGNQGAVGVNYMLQGYGTANYMNQVTGSGQLGPNGFNGPMSLNNQVTVEMGSASGAISSVGAFNTVNLDTHISGLTNNVISASVTVGGAANPGNNGTFFIGQFPGGANQTISFTNPNAVYPDANSGSLYVQIDLQTFNFQLAVQGFSGTQPTYSFNGHRHFYVDQYRPVVRANAL
jgi:hypothetical protein